MAGLAYHEVQRTRVLEYCPSADSTGVATEVHVFMHLERGCCPVVLRFASPHELDEHIEALLKYRSMVWSAAERGSRLLAAVPSGV